MLTAGVDEAGRGPLAGPVIAGAVILNPKKRIKGLTDSKLLTLKKRESLFAEICEKALAFSFGRAEVHEIDRLNIFKASMLAMRRAVENLMVKPDQVLVDGNHKPQIKYPVEAIVGGDLEIPAISAASIVAKVLRDREMSELDAQYPEYGFAKHKGYGTSEHLKVLRKIGPCAIHRNSFFPVRQVIDLMTGESSAPLTGLSPPESTNVVQQNLILPKHESIVVAEKVTEEYEL